MGCFLWVWHLMDILPEILQTFIITRDSEAIMFHSVCMFVCLCVCLCLSRCLSGRFIYEGLVPHKQYFAGALSGMSSCASYVSRTHDVIDDVTRSQSSSNFEIDISPSIFELEHRSKVQNVGNANGLSRAQNGGHFENFEILNTASIWPQIWKRSSQIMPQKVFFMTMMSSMTSQGGLKDCPQYSFINEITFFMITKKRANISYH